MSGTPPGIALVVLAGVAAHRGGRRTCPTDDIPAGADQTVPALLHLEPK